jgi:hypothetical protein
MMKASTSLVFLVALLMAVVSGAGLKPQSHQKMMSPESAARLEDAYWAAEVPHPFNPLPVSHALSKTQYPAADTEESIETIEKDLDRLVKTHFWPRCAYPRAGSVACHAVRPRRVQVRKPGHSFVGRIKY